VIVAHGESSMTRFRVGVKHPPYNYI
jgi:hypothetical protein